MEDNKIPEDIKQAAEKYATIESVVAGHYKFHNGIKEEAYIAGALSKQKELEALQQELQEYKEVAADLYNMLKGYYHGDNLGEWIEIQKYQALISKKKEQ